MIWQSKKYVVGYKIELGRTFKFIQNEFVRQGIGNEIKSVELTFANLPKNLQ